ncbi:hypothetical protein DFQ26_001870 [Actinomortierella ambigua]|nr:hypothetical protein DFQ26_001870 [Actinomortierella ambigua]
MESNPGSSTDHGQGRSQGQDQGQGQKNTSHFPPDRKDTTPIVRDNIDNDAAVSEQETFGNQQPFAHPPAVPPYAPPQYEDVSASAPFPSYQHQQQQPPPPPPPQPQQQESTHPFENDTQPFLQPQQPYAPYANPNAPYQYDRHQPPPRHPQYFPQPPYPQQAFPSHPYPNYGAIPSGAGAGAGTGPSYPSPFPLGQRIDDHHRDLQHKLYDPRHLRAKRKKRRSCCKKFCCWILILLVLAMFLPNKKLNWFPGSIERCDSQDAPKESFIHSFSPSADGDLKVQIKGGISASVKVIEASSSSQDHVNVRYDVYASDSQLASTIKQRSQQYSRGNAQESRINLEEVKFPRYGCANVAVEISYPHQLVKAKRLEVKIDNGNIHYTIGDPQKLTLGELLLSSFNGGINAQAAVEGLASFKLLNGGIQGRLTVGSDGGSGGSVRADATNGAVDLAITSRVPQKLDVKLEAKNGRVNATLSQAFEGHFLLATANGRAQLLLPSSSTDDGGEGETVGKRPRPPPVDDPSGYRIVYKEQRANVKEGWMSRSGNEPVGELPRVRLSTFSGAVILRVEK